MKPKELNPEGRRAVQNANRELERITRKYRHDRILDDGRSDALSYAIIQLECARETRNDREIERWIPAIDSATRQEEADWEGLRHEIEKEGRVLMKKGKGDEVWENEGRSLVNLADSI